MATELHLVGRTALRAFADRLVVRNDDEREQALVFLLVAEVAAEELDCRVEDTFATVVELCGGTGQRFARGLAAVDRRTADAIREWLLRVRIRYADPRNGPTTRTIEIMFGADENSVHERAIEQGLSRDDLPADVRAQMIQEGLTEIAFQLYTRST